MNSNPLNMEGKHELSHVGRSSGEHFLSRAVTMSSLTNSFVTGDAESEQREDSLQHEKVSEEVGLKMRDGVVLRPQPSDDPNDPLNWSSFRKHMAMASISYLALVCYVTVTALVPATLSLAKQFHVPKGTAVYLGNTPVALYAVGPLLWSPLSHFIGRRPVLLLCNVIAIVGTAVAATAQTYGTCMAGRVILGLGGSAFWSLGPASIGDIVSTILSP
jgi:hypothetical protein